MAVLQDQVQAEVLLGVNQPEVTGGRQVKGQPAHLSRPHFSLVQQQELHFAGERKVCKWIQGVSRLKAKSIECQFLSGVSLFGCRLKYSICSLDATLKTKMNTSVRQKPTVMKHPLWFVTNLLFLRSFRRIFIPEMNRKRQLTGVYENNLIACGLRTKMASCRANDIKWVYHGLINAKSLVWSSYSYSAFRKYLDMFYVVLDKFSRTLDLKWNNDFEVKVLEFEGLHPWVGHRTCLIHIPQTQQESNTLKETQRFYGLTEECRWLAKSDTWPQSNWECVSFAEDQTERKK